MLINGLGIGVPYGTSGGGSGGSGSILATSSLYLPLKTTIVPTRGASTPTFTRATAAWDFDNEGKLNLNIPSGCPRFTGARFVRNKLLASEDFTSVSWSKIRTTVSSGAITLGGVTLDAVLETVDNNTHHIDQTISITPGGADTVSVYVAKLGRRYVTLDISNVSSIVVYDLDLGVVASTFGSECASASITDVGSGVFRISMTVSETASTTGVIRLWTAFDENSKTAVGYVGDITKGFYATRVQVENVSGQADQTASEYVSVDVLSAPFHGAGVDGCKYFTTEKSGGAIPSATLKGYLAEPSRVNNCLRSRDASHATWTKSNITATLTVTGLDNVANSASRLTAAANDATLLQLLTAATGTRTTSVWIKRVSGSGTVSLTRNGGTNWTDITSSLVAGTWVPVEVTSDVGANPTVGLKMGTSGDVIDVDCFQDENGAWRTSPILTTTAAVTRNADVLSYNSAFDVAQGTSLCTLNSAVSAGSSMYALGSEAGARLMYWSTGTGRAQGVVYDGTTTKSASGSDVNTGTRKRGSRWGPDLVAAADGSVGTPAAFDGGMGVGGGLFVGCSEASVFQLSGNIGEVHIWTSALTDAQMQQVTT